MADECEVSEPLRVLVTGAGGQTGYCLVYMIAQGQVFGPDQPLVLHLLDLPQRMDALEGVAMELEDCAFSLLCNVLFTADPAVAFHGVHVAFLVGAVPRGDTLTADEYLAANVQLFKQQGQALDAHASKEVKVCVVGNPVNTNCLVCATNAPTIPRENFTALTRLDQNRAASMIAKQMGVPADNIHNIIIWGNNSSTEFPDAFCATVTDNVVTSLVSNTLDDEFLRGELMERVMRRDEAVTGARKLSSAMSTAKAACDHMHDWWFGTAPGQFVCMGVISDGSYGIPAGLCFSFPLQIKKKRWTIVPGLTVDEFSRQRLDATTEELLAEKAYAMALFKQ